MIQEMLSVRPKVERDALVSLVKQYREHDETYGFLVDDSDLV